MTAHAPAVQCSANAEARPAGISSGPRAGTWNAHHPRRSTYHSYWEANGVHPRSVLGVVVVFAVVLVLVASTIVAWPRDLDGRYANSPLKQWFDQLVAETACAVRSWTASKLRKWTGIHRMATIACGSVENGLLYLTRRS
jgi:hypothetical protein